MDIFQDTKIDFLKYKLPAMLLSLVIIVAGFVSIYLKHGLRYGVDFSGGTAIHLKLRHAVSIDSVRKALSQSGYSDSGVQAFSEPTELLIRIPQTTATAEQTDVLSRRVTALIQEQIFKGGVAAGKKDLNSASTQEISQYLQLKDPLGSHNAESYQAAAQTLEQTKRDNSGLFPAFNNIQGVDAKLLSALQQDYYIGDVAALSTEYVGPQVGADLRSKATLAVAWSLVGMLIYIWARFEFTWSFAVIICLLHDVLVTLAFVSFFDREISLTVIAAFLTIVGYSVNDTVVIYDRVADNLKSMRGQPLQTIFNTSINQTLSRTILTSGTVFLVTIVLYLFGGAVINDFAFCMLVGVISGTYSTIYQASAMIVLYEQKFGKKKKPASVKSRAGAKVS